MVSIALQHSEHHDNDSRYSGTLAIARISTCYHIEPEGPAYFLVLVKIGPRNSIEDHGVLQPSRPPPVLRLAILRYLWILHKASIRPFDILDFASRKQKQITVELDSIRVLGLIDVSTSLII